jgi:hypothetical protein
LIIPNVETAKMVMNLITANGRQMPNMPESVVFHFVGAIFGRSKRQQMKKDRHDIGLHEPRKVAGRFIFEKPENEDAKDASQQSRTDMR